MLTQLLSYLDGELLPVSLEGERGGEDPPGSMTDRKQAEVSHSEREIRDKQTTLTLISSCGPLGSLQVLIGLKKCWSVHNTGIQ